MTVALLGWADETRNYDRVATSLRRWKGLSIFSDRAFYDHEQQSWVNRDFGVFDNLVIYRREVIQGKAALGLFAFRLERSALPQLSVRIFEAAGLEPVLPTDESRGKASLPVPGEVVLPQQSCRN